MTHDPTTPEAQPCIVSDAMTCWRRPDGTPARPEYGGIVQAKDWQAFAARAAEAADAEDDALAGIVDELAGGLGFAANPPAAELGAGSTVEGPPVTGIGWAIAALREGLRVRRRGWNGQGMYLELQVPDEKSKMTLPYVFIRTAQGDRVPWLCSQADLLAGDWEVWP